MDDLSSVRNEVRLLLEEEVVGIRQEGMVDVKNESLLRDHPEQLSHFNKDKNFNRENRVTCRCHSGRSSNQAPCSLHHSPTPPTVYIAFQGHKKHGISNVIFSVIYFINLQHKLCGMDMGYLV